jgi:hypothetical protein
MASNKKKHKKKVEGRTASRFRLERGGKKKASPSSARRKKTGY